MENCVRHFFHFFKYHNKTECFVNISFLKKVIALKKVRKYHSAAALKPWTLGWRGERFAIVLQNVIFSQFFFIGFAVKNQRKTLEIN